MQDPCSRPWAPGAKEKGEAKAEIHSRRAIPTLWVGVVGAGNESQNDGEDWICRRALLRIESRVRAGSPEENSPRSRTKTQDHGLRHAVSIP